MNHSNSFLLRNLLNLRDLRGEIDEEALENVLDYFRDELYLLREADELSQGHEAGTLRREEAFKERAEEKLLSINQ